MKFLDLRTRDMAEEKVLKFRRAAEYFYSENEELENTIPTPFIIAMKGDPVTGRKLVAFYAASILRSPLIKEQDFDDYEEKTDENQARIGRKICKLASSQLKSGRSVIIDTELAKQNEFDLLKDLAEINKTPLAVIECRVDDAIKLWDHRDNSLEPKYSIGPITSEFLEEPTSRYINPTNYNMGDILKIPVEMDYTTTFNELVPYALLDLRDHINPNFESKETDDCDHYFLLNRDEEYKRRCQKCSQLVLGSFYRCCFCRLIVHRACCYFPESLDLSQGNPFHSLTLNLRNGVPELDADAICSCCKQALTGMYYSTDDGLALFDLDCLFSLPAKCRINLHEHELLRFISTGKYRCKGCDDSIGENSIFYYCMTCHSSFDVYCVWLPETAEFNHHRHPFKLSIVPAVDSLPYYCEVCQDERNTECWIYYCAECDYPIHPHCLMEAPSLLRSLSTQLSISNKKSKEKLTATEFQDCNSYLSREEHRSEAKELHLSFKELLKEIELPILVMTKGHSDSGRKLVASIFATVLDCLLIDEDNMCEVTNIANESKQVCYQEFSRIALSQLQIGLSVVIDSDLSHGSEFFILQDLAIATKTPLFIVECKQCSEDKHEDFHEITNLCSDYEYDVGDTPKLFVDVTTPTFDAIKELLPRILHSISSYSKQWRKGHSKEPKTQYCYKHAIRLGLDYDVSEGECNRCSKNFSSPILKCYNCPLVLHKSCSELPLRIHVGIWNFILEKYAGNNDKFRCDCCNEFMKDYAYTSRGINYNYLICLDCWFTPPKPIINLHEHPLQLSLFSGCFHCKACGIYCKQRLRFDCTKKDCYFEIGIKCGLLKETVPFGHHRHPFHLIVSPEHISNQYYCEVCQEERDKNHWVYCCIGCDYFIHVRCLVPAGGCTPLES